MKEPQIIELEDGSKWELQDSNTHIPESINRVSFGFKRLPPPNPMPALRVGYILKQTTCVGEDIVVQTMPEIRCFCTANRASMPMLDLDSIYEIRCPSNGLIWSREK